MMTNIQWDAPENEAQNAFVSWGKPGDYIFGTLVGRKQVESTLPDKKGEKQYVYEIKVQDCSYHDLDEKKQPVDTPTTPEKGEVVSVGGRKMIDSRMGRVKLGQLVGLKFTEELEPKTKGYDKTKKIKTFTPKGEDGNYLMDEEWLKEQEQDETGYENF